MWIHAADAEAARTGTGGKNDGKVTSYLLKAEFYRTLLSLTRRGATRMIPIKEVSEFADGQTIDVPGRPRARSHARERLVAGASARRTRRALAIPSEPLVRTGRRTDSSHASGSAPRPPGRCRSRRRSRRH